MTHLVALLLNPKTGDSITTTEKNVSIAAKILGAETFEMTNLSSVATKDGPELNSIAINRDVWSPARQEIADAISRADLILAAWGKQQFAGKARREFGDQCVWVLAELERHRFNYVVTLDGLPRHPSRWRMYLGPQRGIYIGGSFESRLELALRSTPITNL